MEDGMKRMIALILLMMLLVSCGENVPNNDTGNPSAGTKPHMHYDHDHNGFCDVCNGDFECPHTDDDSDGDCDYCGKSMFECTVHSDSDNNGKCDNCGETVQISCREHSDANGDNKCDTCGADTTVVCLSHVDGNKDGTCDSCYVSVVVVLDFYSVNDVHGKFANSDDFTGVDELTTYLKNAYATDDNAVILSSGDMWQGSSESNLTRGYIITEWMNDLDFVGMALGNHEFDWGTEYIKLNSELAEFPFLAINVYETATNELASFCRPSVMIERGGIKIGVIGAVGDVYSSISASKVTDVYFKTGSALTALVKAEAERLRAAGAEFIVYSIHDGYEDSSSSVQDMSASSMSAYYDTALSNGYVDLVFEAHTHQSYIHRDNYGVYHLQTGGDDSGVAHVELALNYVTDQFSVSIVDIVDSYEYQSLADDPIVETLLAKYAEQLAIASKYLGTSSSYKSSNVLRQKIADLYYQYGVEKWGDEYDIALGGGFLSVRSPYDISAGPIYYGDILNIFPFDNDIVLCKISGYNLKKRFFETTNSNYFISYGDYGASIKNNINTSATYYIVVDTYSLDYAANGLTYVDTLEVGKYARDLLAEYVMAGGFGTGVGSGDTGSGGGTDTDTPTYTITPIKTILDKLDTLDYNVSTEAFYVKGTIVSISSTKYGNCTIRDENGDTIYVYGLYDGSGNRYDYMSTKPVVGDTVILYATAKYYKKDSTSTPIKELCDSTVVQIIGK